MRKFSRSKDLPALRKACRAAKLKIDTARYDRGSDYVTVSGKFAGLRMQVVVSPWNGHFMGETPDGRHFTHESEQFDGEDWYRAILDLVYVPAPEQGEAA